MKFTFRSGTKPLEGFTLKRGVGQGGFGEVYLAISDFGKEVALKLLHKHAEIELRGVEPCLNIKHPNLLHLYDLRKDSRGNYWLVMEYILGDSLAGVLPREGRGLPESMVREWFLALARAVNHLHDHCIVHRDLKPGNIFIEHGTLKVGDYGLCKTLSDSKAGNTANIGTVHYMAPEISRGDYNKQIDVYACGIILYEMLTGKPPFDGESVGEILMKHLTEVPDLAHIPDAYREIVRRALDKNPVRRYPGMLEMAQEIEALDRPKPVIMPMTLPGDTPIQSPVYVRQELAATIYRSPSSSTSSSPSRSVPQIPTSIPLTMREKVSEIAGSLALVPVFALATTLIFAGLKRSQNPLELSHVYFLTLVLCGSVLIPAKFWKPRQSGFILRRMTMTLMGGLIGAFAFWMHGWTPQPSIGHASESWWNIAGVAPEGRAEFAGYVLYFAFAMGLVSWWKIPTRERAERFTLFPIIVAVFVGVPLMVVWRLETPPAMVLGSLAAMACIVQIVSPWQPIVKAVPPRKLRLTNKHTPVPQESLSETATH